MGNRGFDHAGFAVSVEGEFKRVVMVDAIEMGELLWAYAVITQPWTRNGEQKQSPPPQVDRRNQNLWGHLCH